MIRRSEAKVTFGPLLVALYIQQVDIGEQWLSSAKTVHMYTTAFVFYIDWDAFGAF